MYVCICKNIKEADIQDAVQNGACSFKELQNQLGVSTCCGECKGHARKCMRKAACNSNASLVAPLIPAAELTTSPA